MGVVGEDDVRPLQAAVAFHVHLIGPVHQDVGDIVILEQRFERPQTDHVVGQLGGERTLLGLVELDPLLGGYLAD